MDISNNPAGAQGVITELSGFIDSEIKARHLNPESFSVLTGIPVSRLYSMLQSEIITDGGSIFTPTPEEFEVLAKYTEIQEDILRKSFFSTRTSSSRE